MEPSQADDHGCGCNTQPSLTTDETWIFVALIHGYNAMAKSATTLGHKLHCRMMRDNLIDKYREAGGNFTKHEPENQIAFKLDSIPEVTFTEEDVELMRDYLANR